MLFSLPINLKDWIDLNRSNLHPPVCNKVIWSNETFVVMIVGGPNIRRDYHINATEELFYQIEGDMVLRVMLEGGTQDITIKEGEMFLLPPMVPHSPQRQANTIGFLVEVIRSAEQKDGFRWYCNTCNYPLYEEFFYVSDITTQLPDVFQRFYNSKEHHKCLNCGDIFYV
jgi:3-hydroxyanthranilate 3,4-dioxygenase